MVCICNNYNKYYINNIMHYTSYKIIIKKSKVSISESASPKAKPSLAFMEAVATDLHF